MLKLLVNLLLSQYALSKLLVFSMLLYCTIKSFLC